jgi:phosphate:Na+ symporter
MAYSGWIDLPTAACLVLGENIGTTITAYLSSLNTNVTARRAARSHTLFNVFGVVWMAIFFHAFLALIMHIIPDTGDKGVIATRLALFHTLFNITNTLLFIPFVTPFSKLVTGSCGAGFGGEVPVQARLQRDRNPAVAGDQHSEGGIRNQENGRSEAGNVRSRDPGRPRSPEKAAHLGGRYGEERRAHGIMRDEISQFLIHCARDNVPAKSQERISSLSRITNEIENIVGSCSKLAKTALIMKEKKIEFDRAGREQIGNFAELVKKFLVFNQRNLGERISQAQLSEAEAFEDPIDRERDLLKKAAQKRIKNRSSHVKTEMLYIDVLRTTSTSETIPSKSPGPPFHGVRPRRPGPGGNRNIPMRIVFLGTGTSHGIPVAGAAAPSVPPSIR